MSQPSSSGQTSSPPSTTTTPSPSPAPTPPPPQSLVSVPKPGPASPVLAVGPPAAPSSGLVSSDSEKVPSPALKLTKPATAPGHALHGLLDANATTEDKRSVKKEDRHGKRALVPAPPPPGLVRVRVEPLTGPSFSLQLYADDTLQSLKMDIYQKTDILPDVQILLWTRPDDGRSVDLAKLSEYLTLKEAGLPERANLRLLIKMQGGPGSFASHAPMSGSLHIELDLDEFEAFFPPGTSFKIVHVNELDGMGEKIIEIDHPDDDDSDSDEEHDGGESDGDGEYYEYEEFDELHDEQDLTADEEEEDADGSTAKPSKRQKLDTQKLEPQVLSKKQKKWSKFIQKYILSGPMAAKTEPLSLVSSSSSSASSAPLSAMAKDLSLPPIPGLDHRHAPSFTRNELGIILQAPSAVPAPLGLGDDYTATLHLVERVIHMRQRLERLQSRTLSVQDLVESDQQFEAQLADIEKDLASVEEKTAQALRLLTQADLNRMLETPSKDFISELLHRGTPSASVLPQTEAPCAAAVVEAPLSEAAPAAAPPPPSDCQACHKKLRLTNRYTCRCKGVFCAQHRYSFKHVCTFDYQAKGQADLQAANPLVKADKLGKL